MTAPTTPAAATPAAQDAPLLRQRRADDIVKLVAIGILGAALLLALAGYIVLLYQSKNPGTLDNVITFIVGAIAGGTLVGGGIAAGVAIQRRSTDPSGEVTEQTTTIGQPPPTQQQQPTPQPQAFDPGHPPAYTPPTEQP